MRWESSPHCSREFVTLDTIGSPSGRNPTLRDGRAEPRRREAYLNSTSRERAASLPTEGSSQ